MKKRLQKLRKLLPEYGIDALVVSHPKNCAYLSGFTGSAATLLIDNQNAYLLTDFRYTEQAKEQCPGFSVVEVQDGLHKVLPGLLSPAGIKTFGLEADHLTYDSFSSLKEKLQEKLPASAPLPVTGVVQRLRVIKDHEEIDTIGRSMHILDLAFNHILGKLKPGASEREISLELEFFTRRQGAEEKAFTFIVASGPRSALPHGVASGRIMQAGDLVTMDFGVYFKGYASDMTRTVALRSHDHRQEKIYNIVLEAQLAGLAAVRAGIAAQEVDQAARGVIERHGYGSYFGHSTGHGVGLEVHENPRLAKNNGTVLEAGMVVTVEPGIYIPGWGGVRIEDTVLVEDYGCRPLCQAPKGKLMCV